ncbi:polyphosphate--glucose phosphotransferase [Fodinicola feengrottensis]|uniref:polyphosphate--glucose phosphotransferase n=1 Tax=Fodinicola feengrottensis TaxID=435914 RepID=UPI0028BDE210|nr:ROK family protein [Fodinicola feengrottensis]
MAQALGVDVGGTGIKAAVVDLSTGELVTERVRVETPKGGKPGPVVETIAGLVSDAKWEGDLGVAFPAVIRGGVAFSAANVDKHWIGTDVAALVQEAVGVKPTVLNDADAAGLAEIRHGAGLNVGGVVLVLTLGTGIGSALFVDGTLVPNTEFGHLELDGHDAERKAAELAREREDLSWKQWAHRGRALPQTRRQPALAGPDPARRRRVSKVSEKWLPFIDVRPPVQPASLRNEAGIVGAAMATADPVAGR